MRWPAKRVRNTSQKSFGMYEKALRLTEQSADLLHLEVGRPSFDTPQHIKDAAKKALDQGLVHYGDFCGELSLRQALAQKLKNDNALSVDAANILVTNGLTHAAYVTCMAALDPGDEVILLEPYYPQVINKIELAGGVVVTALLDATNGFCIDEAAIRAKLSSRTRMLALVNPANPTGRVYTKRELEILAEIAKEHDLLVMSDEVYEKIVFDGHVHTSIASLPGMAERTISQFAFTKAYAMDGWRLGYLVAPEKFMPALLMISVSDVAHVNVFIQEGARVAVEGSQECLTEMVAEDQRRRDVVCRRLSAIPGISCSYPEGTIYAFPDVSVFGSSQDVADAILEYAGVVTEAGTFYGRNGEGHLRICFGSEDYERLNIAMDRLEDFFHSRS